MTRSASFNKIWGYEALQIADENNEKTQEFMRSGWEGGSDKKAPSASVQNYHMQKTDQALQEVERQGYLSWRSDVPYSKGARVFFHGSTFHALKDNQDVEPQGSRDNNVWYLIPVQVYPTRYESVEGLGTAAKHNAEDFDPKGSAKAVDQSLSSIAKTGKLNDGADILDMKRGGTGRSDGDLQAGTVFAHTVKNNGGAVTLATEGGDTVSVENGNVLSMKNANKDEKFRVDDGNISFGGGWKDPNIFKEDGDIVIRASSGERLRIEKDGAVTIKDKNGVETCRIQNGLITLAGGSRPNLQRTPYSMMMFADSGDSVSVESGGTVIGKKANGDTIVKMQEGKLFLNGEDRPVLQRLDSGTFIDSKSGDYLSIEPGNALVVHNSSGETTLKIENGTLTVGTIPFDHVSGDVPLSRVSGAGDAAKWGVWDNNNPDEFIDGQTKLVSLGTLKGLRDRLQTAYGISTFATARKIDGGPVKYNDNIPGTHLVTSGSAGDDGSPTLLSGTWKCLGEAKNNSGISLYVRIS